MLLLSHFLVHRRERTGTVDEFVPRAREEVKARYQHHCCASSLRARAQGEHVDASLWVLWVVDCFFYYLVDRRLSIMSHRESRI